jgi:toxin ParE1/3/4
VAEGGKRWRLVLAPSARADIQEALHWSHEKFGEQATGRYRDLIKQALRDIVADPERPGSAVRSDLARGVRTYHLFFSRERARGSWGIVKRPRHFLVYRRRGEDIVDILRVIHDARDLERHLPEQDLNDPERFHPEEY